MAYGEGKRCSSRSINESERMKKLKYFSTFTGIGGLDHGLEVIGAKCVGYSEIKESSIDIYSRHFPTHHNFGDITKIVPEDLPDFDVFTGGFPCQTFSMAGMRKGFKDRKGTMIFYIFDILMAKKPEFFVLENVKGIATHDSGRTYKKVIKLLSSAGYKVRVVLLNSSHYGSAQARERVVFIGRLGKDFPKKAPELRKTDVRFRDIRTPYEPKDVLSEATMARFTAPGGDRYFELIGGYDRVNTITTGVSSSGRKMLVTMEPDGIWRRITCLEAERLQNFPDGYTDGSSTAKRWFALGNAVNCAVSDYLFTDYLKSLWWK